VTLLTPIDWTIDVTVPVTLTWEAAARATRYTLQITTDIAGEWTRDVTNIPLGNVTTYDLGGLSPGMAYYWRVFASNSAGDGDFSYTNRFDTQFINDVELIDFATVNGWTLSYFNGAVPANIKLGAYNSVCDVRVLSVNVTQAWLKYYFDNVVNHGGDVFLP
jgi:hypothetical protein